MVREASVEVEVKVVVREYDFTWLDDRTN